MIRVGGLPLDDVFDRTRLRVSDLTKGAQISWDASKLKNDFTFFDRGPDAPATQVSSYDNAAIRTKAIRDFDERDAYFAALDRDTLQGYEDFLAAYPNDSMARRVRAIIAARREAITPARDMASRYAGGLLVLSQALSARSPRVGCSPPPRTFRGSARAAAVLHSHRI